MKGNTNNRPGTSYTDKEILRVSLVKYRLVEKMSLEQAIYTIHNLYVVEPIMKS